MTATGGTFPGQTVTLKLQWVALPAASAAEQITEWLPRPKLDPEGGTQRGIPATEHQKSMSSLRIEAGSWRGSPP